MIEDDVYQDWLEDPDPSRKWLALLEDPLHYEIDLPGGFEELEDQCASAQEELRQAVAASELLQTEAREYGEDWLRNRIKVHVNITNPSDTSFRSKQVVPIFGILGAALASLAGTYCGIPVCILLLRKGNIHFDKGPILTQTAILYLSALTSFYPHALSPLFKALSIVLFVLLSLFAKMITRNDFSLLSGNVAFVFSRRIRQQRF